MLISAPFLTSGLTEDSQDSIRHAFTGQYPVTSHLEWHNGQHLIAPQEAGVHLPVRAIADGTVIFAKPVTTQANQDKEDPQNYAAFGDTPEWTDKGIVIIAHSTEIGAEGAIPTTLTFYSVYAQLRELADGMALGKKVCRKDILGQPGQIYGQPGHIHFEICLDDANIKLLLGRDPKNWPTADAVPTKDGRTDAVFGSTYIYLPASTPVQTTAPTPHMRGTATQTLGTPQWVRITYAGQATITSYTKEGTETGHRTDPDAEYELYQEATRRHDSLGASDKARSSPSGWYELLRFGRNLGRGPADADKDPLPRTVAHWRQIHTPVGERWADLNAEGSFKFSDADFPAFLGWNCFADDCEGDAALDQRCDSPKLKALLTSAISDTREKADTIKDHARLFRQIRVESIAKKLRLAICKFPTEFDQENFLQRYGHIQEEEYFHSDPNGTSWNRLCNHIKALTFTDLPQAYKGAQWHLHPMAFIEVMRKCGWLSKEEFTQLLPSHAVRSGKWSDAQHRSHDGVFWEPVNTRLANERSLASIHRIPLNKTLRKYGMTTPMRNASFFGNAVQETSWLSDFSEGHCNDTWYAPWFGRGFLQLTGPGNYVAYWRWRGRPFSASLETSLKAAYDDMYVHSARRTEHLLADANFAGVTREIQDWRDQVHGEEKISQDEGRLAPADSAGFYAVWNNLLRHADEAHSLERRAVATVDPVGRSTGEHVYYRSQAFWKVSASVNLPGAVKRTNYSGINGFDSRCSAYGVALAVLTETRFPNAQAQAVLEYPEGFTPRRG